MKTMLVEAERLEAESKKKVCGSKYSYVCQVESQQKEIESLKLKLSEAEMELKTLKKEITSNPPQEREYCQGCSLLKAKLSGSCEGMTIGDMAEIIKQKRWKHQDNGYLKFTSWEIAEAIHAQMTGGKK